MGGVEFVNFHRAAHVVGACASMFVNCFYFDPRGGSTSINAVRIRWFMSSPAEREVGSKFAGLARRELKMPTATPLAASRSPAHVSIP